MISFQPTEEESAFVDLAGGVARERIRPMATECEQERRVHPDLVKTMMDLGFTTLELPHSWGGLEMPLISQTQIWGALSHGDLGVVQGLPGAGDGASLIRLIPEHPALQSYKAAGADGDWPTVAFLQAADGENPGLSGVQAVSNGSGYVLRGISLPFRLAAFADSLLVAVNDPEGETLLLWLDRREDSRWHAVEGDYRLGLLAAGCARVQFEEEVITSDQVIARGSEARELLSQAQARIYVLEAAKEVGLMEAAVSYTAEYTSQRKAFGQEIAKFQGVSFTLADMAIETRTSRNLLWQTAERINDGDSTGKEAAGGMLSRVHRSLRFVTDSAVQLLGGHGYVQEFPVEKWMRDAQAQVSLYGREGELLARRGEQLLGDRVPTGT
ncbi:acyl-CoA dehydrogenase family protein [Kroppenstedtia guangzhouensis]|uniref:acyl-CoA dehydrogenase family protein n=1 Tax=Kroppenstedtia guangzhouensis TaxID=1274356 RepID=UPI00166A3487|nr:acyl-CoA dehydrogenase family protein [Kroppenstedtia guangzhouensis]